MPKLIVKGGHQGTARFDLRQGDTIIGRGEDAHLVLNNVSVSRHHAKISVKGQKAVLSDMESQNGVILNGQPTPTAELKSGDEIRLGRFNLVYLTDSRNDRFYKGRYVEYLPAYEAKQTEAKHEATYAMTKEALAAMQRDSRFVEDGRVVLMRDTKRFWMPENRKLTFGQVGMIQVEGWFTWGTLAEVTWSGKAHVLTRLAWWTTVKVNDKSVEEAPLKPGDVFQVGGTSFKYEVD